MRRGKIQLSFLIPETFTDADIPESLKPSLAPKSEWYVDDGSGGGTGFRSLPSVIRAIDIAAATNQDQTIVAKVKPNEGPLLNDYMGKIMERARKQGIALDVSARPYRIQLREDTIE